MQKQDEKTEEIFDKLEEKEKVEIEQDVKNEPKQEKAEKPKKGKKEKVEAEEVEASKEEKPERKKGIVEQQKEDYEKKKAKNKRRIKIAIIIGAILFILLIFSIIFSLININNNEILSGISVNGIEVSGLSKEEATEKLESLVTQKKTKEILLKHEEFETQINPELIEVNYNLDGAIEAAYNIGRDSNIFVNNYNILFTMLGKKDIEIEVTINEEELEKTLKDAGSKIPGAIEESSYYIEDDNLIITKGKKGLVIDIEETVNKIKEDLKDITKNDTDYIELKVSEKEPKEINIEEIYEEVHQEAKDAYYIKEPFEIFPEVNGVDFNVEEAKQLLSEDKEEYTIRLTITRPNVTIEDIGAEAFPDRLAVFTTRYDASNVNRTTNLRLACEKINGAVILSGETFSYNKTLGERTIAAGYKEAAIYSAGQVVDGLGGGICQISSTLYNAVLMANLEIVERRNHQFVTSYLPAGRDATVVYGITDFQFKNTRKYPVRLTASVQNGIATIEVFGIKEDEEYTITFETRTVGTTPYSTKYIEDSSLEEGREVVTQNGANGLQTETYIVKNLDGKVTRELLSKDTYTPMQKIVRKGTKAVTPTVTPTPEPTPTPAPTQQQTTPSQSTPAQQQTTPTPAPAQTQTPASTPTSTTQPTTQQSTPGSDKTGETTTSTPKN